MSSPEKAIEVIRAGQRIFVHGAAATPHALLAALFLQAERLTNTELIHLHLEGKIPYADENVRKNFKAANLFVGQNVRDALDYENIDYLPCFLSEIPLLFRSKKRPIDIALIHVSPPDQHGFCSLGVKCGYRLYRYRRSKDSHCANQSQYATRAWRWLRSHFSN